MRLRRIRKKPDIGVTRILRHCGVR
ncbi:hypothetical protein DESC_610033 [Desulfosarcina cetonica]|nr:hypothetical protein DESC_610033 [Desulfosarcina cetonica]